MDYLKEFENWKQALKNDQNAIAELSSLKDDEIEDRFYKDLDFGTAGLRGIMELGTNRMNNYVIRRVTQGVANEIIETGEEAMQRGVAIAFDSRNNSPEFAMEAAKVLCANGIKTYLFESLRPPPELSFTVRHLNCARGIVITASHNPKQYNGYKVYGDDGSQISPETANKIVKYISEIDMFTGA